MESITASLCLLLGALIVNTASADLVSQHTLVRFQSYSLNVGIDPIEFRRKRDPAIDFLFGQKLIDYVDFEIFYNVSSESDYEMPNTKIAYIDHWPDFAAEQAASDAMRDRPEILAAFADIDFSLSSPVYETVQEDSDLDFDIAQIFGKGAGIVLEYQVRDFDKYDNFDKLEYEKARSRYLVQLSSFNMHLGSWIWSATAEEGSAATPNYEVIASVWRSKTWFYTARSQANYQDEDITSFFATYPIVEGWAGLEEDVGVAYSPYGIQTNADGSDDDDGLSTGAIVGIVVGAVVVLLVFVWFVMKSSSGRHVESSTKDVKGSTTVHAENFDGSL